MLLRRLRGKTRRAVAFPKLRCEHCEKTFSSKLRLAVHVHQVHSGEYEPPVCQYCGVTRSGPERLRLHILRKHTERLKRVKCPFPGCKKDFKTFFFAGTRLPQIWETSKNKKKGFQNL